VPDPFHSITLGPQLFEKRLVGALSTLSAIIGDHLRHVTSNVHAANMEGAATGWPRNNRPAVTTLYSKSMPP